MKTKVATAAKAPGAAKATLSATAAGAVITAQAATADHLIDVDGAGEDAGRAWCSCGWTSETCYSRRRAHEAAGDHLRKSTTDRRP